MNRAGRPMFYGAADSTTARAEIGHAPPGRDTIVGEWTFTQPPRLLDLVAIQEPPDFYDIDRAWLRWRLLFLHDFAEDVSQPVGPHACVEYRATQVFMDYLRSRDSQVNGILYRSSLTGEPCCAVDVDNSHCIDGSVPFESTNEELTLTLKFVHVERD